MYGPTIASPTWPTSHIRPFKPIVDQNRPPTLAQGPLYQPSNFPQPTKVRNPSPTFRQPGKAPQRKPVQNRPVPQKSKPQKTKPQKTNPQKINPERKPGKPPIRKSPKKKVPSGTMVQPAQPEQPAQPGQPGDTPLEKKPKRKYPPKSIKGKVNVNRFRNPKFRKLIGKGSKKTNSPINKKSKKPVKNPNPVQNKPNSKNIPKQKKQAPNPPPVQEETKPAQNNLSGKFILLNGSAQ